MIGRIKSGDFSGTETAVRELLSVGEQPKEIIMNGIVSCLDEVGKAFAAGEAFIPEMLIAAKASQRALNILRPTLVGTDYQASGKVVIGTVQGDMHDIGKNIVAMVLEAAGFEVIDLGVNVSPEKFSETVSTRSPDIVALSCLLTTTMPGIRKTIEKLAEDGLRSRVKVVIGGPPTSEAFAAKAGADFYARDAFEGVALLRSVIGKAG
jgi:5-methyltetrahydrofolate--homocysteine methyltransferase